MLDLNKAMKQKLYINIGRIAFSKSPVQKPIIINNSVFGLLTKYHQLGGLSTEINFSLFLKAANSTSYIALADLKSMKDLFRH